MPEPGRKSGYCGCVFVILVFGVVLHSLVHVFHTARIEAIASRVDQARGRVCRAVLLYAKARHDLLPGSDWSDAIRPYEPTLDADLRIEFAGEGVGLAMMPKVIGRRLRDLKPETVLLVEYRGKAANLIALDPDKVVDGPAMGYVRVSTKASPTLTRVPLAEVRAQIART